MFENNKTDCIDSIKFGTRRTRQWRTRCAVKHSLDPRNAKAADYLDRLSDKANQLTDADWLRLQPHFNWTSERWREAISQTARAVGFTSTINDFPSFVEHLVGLLSQPQVNA
jgi:hypothetical protein